MSSKLVVLVTAAGCIAAAGVGSYLAVGHAPAGQAAAQVETDRLVTAAAASTPAPVTRQRAQATARATSNPSDRGLATPRTTTNEPPLTVGSETAPTTATEERPAEPSGSPDSAATPENGVADSADPAPDGPTADSTATAPAPLPYRADEDIVVAADSVLGIRVETPVSSATSRIEDRVLGRLTRDVTVDGRTVIPAGTEILGHVSVVERGGRVRERARLGVRFTSLVVGNRTRIPIQTDTVYREGEPPATEATAKIGASAVIGGIIGGVFGGKRGAAIGSAAGAAGGTAVVMTGDRNDATLPAGSTITLRLSAPITVPIDGQ